MIPEFKPEGLEEFIKLRERNTSDEADRIVKEIELELHSFILLELKEEFGEQEESWFFNGVPLVLRKRIDNDRNEEAAQKGKPPAREQKFYLIDFRDLICHNWDLFKDVLGQGKKNASKEKGTAWLVKVNEIRKTAAHPTRGPVSLDDLDYLKQEQTWLRDTLRGRKHQDEASEETA